MLDETHQRFTQDLRRWELAAAALFELSKGNPLGGAEDLASEPMALNDLLRDYEFDDGLRHYIQKRRFRELNEGKLHS